MLHAAAQLVRELACACARQGTSTTDPSWRRADLVKVPMHMPPNHAFSGRELKEHTDQDCPPTTNATAWSRLHGVSKEFPTLERWDSTASADSDWDIRRPWQRSAQAGPLPCLSSACLRNCGREGRRAFGTGNQARSLINWRRSFPMPGLIKHRSIRHSLSRARRLHATAPHRCCFKMPPCRAEAQTPWDVSILLPFHRFILRNSGGQMARQIAQRQDALAKR